MCDEVCVHDDESLSLPKSWHSFVRNAVLNVIGIVRIAVLAGREALIKNRDAREARIHQLEPEVAMLREELRVARTVQEALLIVPIKMLGDCCKPHHWHFVLWPKIDEQLTAFTHPMRSTHAPSWPKTRHGESCRRTRSATPLHAAWSTLRQRPPKKR